MKIRLSFVDKTGGVIDYEHNGKRGVINQSATEGYYTKIIDVEEGDHILFCRVQDEGSANKH